MFYYDHENKNIIFCLQEIFQSNIASIIFDYYYIEYVEWEFDENILIPLENLYT